MATVTAPRGTSTNGKQPDWPKLTDVPVDLIDVDDNVRADVGDIADLAESIRLHGVMQPITVALSEKPDRFSLVVGQRRLAAAKLAGLPRIPAIFDAQGAKGTPTRSIRQLVENIQRRDLNPLEEARALRGILDASKGMTQDELAAQVGRSRPAVTNLLRILDTEAAVQDLVAGGVLSAAHAKAIAGVPAKQQVEWAAKAIDHSYSAHRLEEAMASDRQWRQRQADEARETSKVRDERVAKAMEKLPDKAAPIVVEKDYYNQGDPILRRFKKAGYTNVTLSAVQSRSDTLGCDCGVTAILLGYNGGISVKPGCVEKKHRDAKWKAERVESERQRDDQARIQKAIGEHLRVALSTLDPQAARVVLWAVMDWSLNDWVREHKGDRKKPDAWSELVDLAQPALAEEIAKFAAKGFGDRYGVKLDWPAIAEAFGVEPPEPKVRKAATS